MHSTFIRRLLYLALLLGCATKTALAASQVNTFAKKITADNAAELVQAGPDAIGGIGDWFFTNGILCAIVSGLEHEGEFSTKGGSLVDLGFCDRADDHFSFTHDLLQGSQRRSLDSQRIELEHDSNSASIIVYGQRDGADIVTRYSLSNQYPTQVHIDKRLTQKGDNDFNFFSSLNFNLRSLEPFVFNSTQLELNNGFKAEDFVSRGISAMQAAAKDADTIVTLSPPSATYPIAYGWHLAAAERVDGEKRIAVPRFMLADDTSNAMIVLTDTFYIGDGSKAGWLQLLQFPLLSLNTDSAVETKEIIYVGERGDVAAITDQFFSDQPLVEGTVNDASSALHIIQANGAPYTHLRPNSDGRFSFHAPLGDYKVVVKGSAKRSIEKSFKLRGAAHQLGDLSLPQAAQLTLPRGQAMRLVFVGLNGTPNPDFADHLTDFSVMEEDGEHFVAAVSNVFLAGVESDLKRLDIAPGDYRVYATRGPEYSLEQVQISVKPGAQMTLDITTPQRLLETPNHIASDLHVHSGRSFDNAFSEQERVRTFVAEHGEVMVSSEHDIPVDFAPRIKAMGVDQKIVSIAAAEVTSLLPTELNPYTGGHANFFPYPPQEHAFRRGMVNHENKRWREVIHSVKQKHPDVLTQLNHSRLTLELSGELPSDWQERIENGHFLDHMGSAGHPYNPTKPLHSHPNSVLIEPHEHTGLRDIDFDLIEIMNPGGIHNDERIQAHRKDWLSFIKQGEKIVGTANSDSHNATEQVAVPRTMVAMKNDKVAEFKQTEFLQALKSGNAYGTTGPMLEASLSGAAMGQTFKGERGQLSLKIQSVDWIPVNRVKIQINGETVDQYQLNEGNEHTLLIPLSFSKDSFVTVEASGPVTDDYANVYPQLSPYAFSNPIYVDFDGDGQWQAPGL